MKVVKIDVSRCGVIAPDAIQGIALDLNPKILYGFPIKLVNFTLCQKLSQFFVNDFIRKHNYNKCLSINIITINFYIQRIIKTQIVFFFNVFVYCMNYQLVNNSTTNPTFKTVKVDNYVIYIKVQQKCNIIYLFS